MLASNDEERRAAAQVLATINPASLNYVTSNPDLAPMIGRPGWQYLVQPFVGQGYNASRFSDGAYGVYYAADTMKTALKEALYHRTRLFRLKNIRATIIKLHCYAAQLEGRLHDIRGRQSELPKIYDAGDPPAAYEASQPFGRALYDKGANGLSYDSVRDDGGQCVGVFRPVAVLHACQVYARICVDWAGHDFMETTTELISRSPKTKEQSAGR